MAAASKKTSVDEIADMIGRAVGHSRAVELVIAAAAHVGCEGPDFHPIEVMKILSELGNGTGIVAIAARFAQSRNSINTPPQATQTPAVSIRPRESIPAREVIEPREIRPTERQSRTAFTLDNIADKLAPTLGREKANSIVTRTATKLSLGHSLDITGVMAILESIAKEPGLTGVAARFAKVALLLDTGDTRK